jgi:hypothetical protein
MALLMLVGMPGMVPAATVVSHSFIGIIEDGDYRMGDFGTGSFSYDSDLIISGDETLTPTDGLLVTFNFDGQDYSNENDISYDDSPELEFDNFTPVFLDYVLENGENGVTFTDNNLSTLETGFDNIDPNVKGYDFKIDLMSTPVPIPGAMWLLGTGLVGLAALRRKNFR